MMLSAKIRSQIDHTTVHCRNNRAFGCHAFQVCIDLLWYVIAALVLKVGEVDQAFDFLLINQNGHRPEGIMADKSGDPMHAGQVIGVAGNGYHG